MWNSNGVLAIPGPWIESRALHAIVTRASSLDGRVSSLTSGHKVGAMTLRNLTTIGSSFKSSFSLAATSMEYVRKTDFTSAACTEIYYEKVSSREINHHLTQTY